MPSRNLTLRPSLFDKSPFVPASSDLVASAANIPLIGGSDKPNAKQRAPSSRRVSKCSMFNSSITNTAFPSRYRNWLCHAQHGETMWHCFSRHVAWISQKGRAVAFRERSCRQEDLRPKPLPGAIDISDRERPARFPPAPRNDVVARLNERGIPTARGDGTLVARRCATAARCASKPEPLLPCRPVR